MGKESRKIMILAGLGLAGLLAFLFTQKAKAAPPPPPPGYANLYGIVTNASTGQPIADVGVRLDGTGGLYDTFTGADGRYIFTSVTPGYYALDFAKATYQPASSTLTLVEGNNQLNVALTPIAPPVGPPFTFSETSVVGTSDYPRAGDWIVPLFKSKVTNPNSIAVSHQLRMMVSSFDTYNNLPWWPPTAVYTWAQTLPAGGGFQYETNFWNETRQAYDILIGRYARWDFWLEDELGNKSEVVSIIT